MRRTRLLLALALAAIGAVAAPAAQAGRLDGTLTLTGRNDGATLLVVPRTPGTVTFELRVPDTFRDARFRAVWQLVGVRGERVLFDTETQTAGCRAEIGQRVCFVAIPVRKNAGYKVLFRQKAGPPTVVDIDLRWP